MSCVRIAFALALVAICPALAQEPPGDDGAELRRRLEELEAQVREMKAERAAPAEAPPAEPLPPADTAPVGSPVIGVALEDEGLLLELPLSLKLTVRGHLRFRGERREPRDYRIPGTLGRPANEDPEDIEDFIVSRAWISLEFDVWAHLRARVAVQDARFWGDTPVGQDNAELFLREGWGEVYDIFGEPLKVRIGRQLFPVLGDGRMFTDADPFLPVPRLWDAVQVWWEPKGWWFTTFAANLREAQVVTPRGDEDDDFWLVGVYASNRMLEGCEFDAYLYWRELSDDLFPSEARPGVPSQLGEREDFSFGARMKVEGGLVGMTAEGVYQAGWQSRDKIAAFAAATKAWVKIPADKDGFKIRLAGEYAFASGDENPNDGRLETFDPLFPFGHLYHGFADQVSWSNIHAASAYLTVGLPPPVDWMSLHLDGHVFWLDKTRDAWYAANKMPIRRVPNGSADSYLGQELDAHVQIRLLKGRVFIWGGVSVFWTGKYVRETGRSEDMTWAQLQIDLNF